MKIIGGFRVEKPKNNLRNMKVNNKGYIFCTDFILSKTMLCIPWNTEVFYSITSIQKIELDSFVEIKKISKNNFRLNIEVDPSFITRTWKIFPYFVARNYATSEDWICIENPPICFEEFSYRDYYYPDSEEIEHGLQSTEDISEFVYPSNLSIDELKEKLNQALDDEDYEAAAKIRDEIQRKIKDL